MQQEALPVFAQWKPQRETPLRASATDASVLAWIADDEQRQHWINTFAVIHLPLDIPDFLGMSLVVSASGNFPSFPQFPASHLLLYMYMYETHGEARPLRTHA